MGAPITLARGEGFDLRYRVCVHAGPWDAARLQSELARYRTEIP